MPTMTIRTVCRNTGARTSGSTSGVVFVACSGALTAMSLGVRRLLLGNADGTHPDRRRSLKPRRLFYGPPQDVAIGAAISGTSTNRNNMWQRYDGSLVPSPHGT